MSETTERPLTITDLEAAQAFLHRGALSQETATATGVTYVRLVRQLTAALQENERLKEELAGEERSRDLHADLNRRSAKALGKPFEGTGSSWHDIPECIAALRAQLASGAEELKQEREASRELLRHFDAQVDRMVCRWHVEDAGTPGEPCGECLTCVSAKLAAEKERGDRLAGLLAEVAITFRNYYAQAISRAAVETMLERMTSALSRDTPTTKPPVLSEEG